MVDVLMELHRSAFSKPKKRIHISPHPIFGLFPPRKGGSEARYSKVINGLQHVFEK
jgi:hypothetical protein